MASYVVMEPHSGSGRGTGRERAVLVRDGFHLLAFLVPALWLLFNRLWLETLLVVAVSVVLSVAGSYAGLGPAAPALSFIVALYVGLEGPALRLAALRRRGWREWGVVEADNAADAEIRYLAGDATYQDEAPTAQVPSPGPSPAQSAPRPPAGPALGLFAYPGKS